MRHEVRQDPYDTDRVWVRHPDTHEWITCFARSIRMAALPFGTTTSANLATTEQVDDPHFEWSQDFLDAESDRVKTAASKNGTGNPANNRSDKASQRRPRNPLRSAQTANTIHFHGQRSPNPLRCLRQCPFASTQTITRSHRELRQ